MRSTSTFYGAVNFYISSLESDFKLQVDICRDNSLQAG